MMQKIILISIILFCSGVTYSQESFKKSLEAISMDLCSKMVEKGKKKIVVLFITDINKSQTTTGKYMADVVSFYIVNNQNGFSVFDRENLSGIAEAKKLIANGYIDVNNAKQLGKILAVEAIVVGNYTVLSNSLSLTLKALDVNDGFVIAQSMKDVTIDNDVGALLGITVGAGENSSNKGFNNRPLNSNESYNNPETVSKDCEKNDTGDYCFANQTNQELTVYHSNNYGGLDTGDILMLKPGETLCFYNLKSGNYKFVITKRNQSAGYRSNWLYSGNFLVEKCKSKTFNIK